MEENDFNAAVGRLVRKARLRAGLTQEALADEVGLSRTSITNMESGNQAATAWLLHLIATALDCPAQELLPGAASNDLGGLPEDVPPKAAELIRRYATR
ncbi:MAG: helix-turn-helix domain-containing protein [Actinomycetes bacterium]